MTRAFLHVSFHPICLNDVTHDMAVIKPAYLGKTNEKHILYLYKLPKTRKSFISIWENLKVLV